MHTTTYGYDPDSLLASRTHDSACPSERGAAGTTPQQVKQSLIGAAWVLGGALPIGDLVDAALGGRAAAGAGSWLSRLLAPKAQTFYRTMSKANFEGLQATGRVPATSETFISPSKEFSSAYEGIMVKFSVRAGTTDALAGVGVRDASAVATAAYPDMPLVSSGWTSTSAFFKGEGGIINIGLGRGTALDIFNEAIRGFGVMP